MVIVLQNPYQKYMQQNVTTMTPGQLVVALYDKAITELNKAILWTHLIQILKKSMKYRRILRQCISISAKI